MESALYLGTVRHRRFAPRAHRFAYPLFMLYVDLDELEAVGSLSRWLSTAGPAWAWLRRRDHFGDPDRPWAESVRRLVEEHTGKYPEGPVRLLTHPRTLGFRMNPISLFYCHDLDGALVAVVGEVTNTPWDERHLYVVTPRTRFSKELHVSPFMPMDMEYRWLVRPPDRRLLVHMESHREGKKVFDATLALERHPLTRGSIRRILWRYPAMTLRVFAWIYLEAALLALRRVPFHTHPRKLAPEPAAYSK